MEEVIEIAKGNTFYDKRLYKYHIVDIIKDGEEDLVISKYYGKNKQWWILNEI